MAAGDPLGEVKAQLTQQFPNTYGGMFQNPDGTFSVVVVGGDTALEATAQSLFSQLPVQYGVTVPASKVLPRFVTGTRSLTALYSIQNQIVAMVFPAGTGGTYSPPDGVFGIGLDPEHGQVVLASTTSTPANVSLEMLVSRFGSAIRTEVQSIPIAHGRTNDSPPWSAGDEIVDSSVQCTLGFGVHEPSNGNHFSLSAGHCVHNNPDTWYNGTQPGKSGYPVIGTTSAYSVSGIDTQLISDNSSADMWKGSGQATLTTITGFDNPDVGSSVCAEGSIGGEQCGTVSQVNQTEPICETINGPCWTDQDLDEVNAVTQDGDSGGPVLFPTVYGPLAAGSIEAGNSSESWFEEIQALTYVWSVNQGTAVTVNTLSSP